MKGPQLPGTLEIAQCLSCSALQKAEDFCTDFLILQGKKIESFWALLHNSFTQTFSSAHSRVRNAMGLYLTYMEGPPVLHPPVGCISFKGIMHPMMLKFQRVPIPPHF